MTKKNEEKQPTSEPLPEEILARRMFLKVSAIGIPAVIAAFSASRPVYAAKSCSPNLCDPGSLCNPNACGPQVCRPSSP